MSVDLVTVTELLGGSLLVLVVFLYSTSHTVRYYLKFLVFLVLCLISATVFIPLMPFRPKDWRNALLPAWGARQVSKLLGLKWTITGKENIVQDSGCIVLINHQSLLDLLVLAELWPVLKNCTVISKREVFYMWPFGLATWLWGTIFINRVKHEEAQATVNKTGETVRTRKAKLCMFPEGTRHGGDELLPFKKGAFHVAIVSQTPVQPVVVSRYYFLNSKTHTFDSGYGLIKILPPIPTTGLSKADLETLVAKAYTVMSEEYTKLTSQALLSKH